MMPSSSFGPSLESLVVESAQISWISPLSASLIFLDLTLVIGPTGTCNRSFNSARWFSSKDYLEVYIYILLPKKKKTKPETPKLAQKNIKEEKIILISVEMFLKHPTTKKKTQNLRCVVVMAWEALLTSFLIALINEELKTVSSLLFTSSSYNNDFVC